MAKPRITWNVRAFEQLRRDPGVVSDLNRRAQAVKDAAGDGYETGSYSGKSRHRASVITATAKAQKNQAKHNTLQRALDAGRG